MTGARHRDRSIHAFYIVIMFTLVLLPTASGAGVNKSVFRYGAGFFLILALLPFIFRLFRLDTRPWSRDHRGLPAIDREKEEGPTGSDGETSEAEEKTPGNFFHTLNDAILRPYHPVFGIVGFLSVLMHAAVEGDCGNSTLIAMAILFGYILTGWGMRSGAPWVGDLRSNRMYHVSWLVALLLIAIIIMHTIL